jgi:transcriptional regulator with XRE-family HTH domain
MKSDELERALGGHLRDLRISQHLTQTELAERANVSVGALKHLESGSGATTTTLVKLLRALGQEQWIDTLGPVRGPFNPLELLKSREKQRSRAAPPTRVRHRRRATQ